MWLLFSCQCYKTLRWSQFVNGRFLWQFHSILIYCILPLIGLLGQIWYQIPLKKIETYSENRAGKSACTSLKLGWWMLIIEYHDTLFIVILGRSMTNFIVVWCKWSHCPQLPAPFGPVFYFIDRVNRFLVCIEFNGSHLTLLLYHCYIVY